jgi:mRNA interferase RelE/StbE
MTSQYKIIFSPLAQKYWKKLFPDIKIKLNEKIDALKLNPCPSGIKVLKGNKGLLRLRIGEYRVIYNIEDDRLIITIIEVRHRSKIYRDY